MPTTANIIVLAALATGLLPAPASAETASCKRELAAISPSLGALPRVDSAAGASSAASCTAYRTQFLEIVRARAVVAACRTGKDRDQEVGRLDGRVEDINGAIAQACG